MSDDVKISRYIQFYQEQFNKPVRRNTWVLQHVLQNRWRDIVKNHYVPLWRLLRSAALKQTERPDYIGAKKEDLALSAQYL